MTIKELADRARVKVTDVKQLAREAFPGEDFSSPDRSLTTEQEQRILARLPERVEERRRRSVEVVAEVEEVPLPPPLVELPVATRSRMAGAPAAGRGTRLLLHQDVFDFLAREQGEWRRLKAAVQRLMREMLVEGRAQRRVKGTRGVNSGWLRAPLGDNGGHHYYLWHALAGMRSVQGLALERGEVVLRAVRHHDETKNVLDPGERGDYLELDARAYVEDVERSEGAADVLSGPQRGVCDHDAPVSITKGHPGAGKTTLQLERTRRHDGGLLFLTFGRAQRMQAERWLETYGHAGQRFVAWTHQDFFTSLDPAWQAAPEPEVAIAELQTALRTDNRDLGPWRGHPRALYAELRGHYWGRAIPFPFRGVAAATDEASIARAYRARRSKVLGDAAVDGVVHAASMLPAELRARLFGDLERARGIATRLAAGALALPEPLAELQAILIDEVQDLTLVEVLACTLVAREVARATGRRPAFHVAGDEGQTVRSTDFEWGELKDLLNESIGRPEEFDLPGNVRSPRTITKVINNSWGLYKNLAKGQRPKGYAEAEVDETAMGSVLWVDLQHGELEGFCKVVAETPGAALIYPDTFVPPDVRAVANTAGVVHVVSAPEAKGLDFRVGFVLDVGRRAYELYRAVPERHDTQIVELENRVAVDAVRVAISRATEVLVFVERPLGRDERARLEMLCADGGQLGDGVVTHVTLAELPDRLDVDTADCVELVTEALADFDRTFEDDPATGLKIAERARGWLGDSRRAGAVQGDLRKLVYRAVGLGLLRTAPALDDDAERSTRLSRANAELNLAKEPGLARLALDTRDALQGDDKMRAAVTNLVASAKLPQAALARLALEALERFLATTTRRVDTLDGRDWERLVSALEAIAEASVGDRLAAMIESLAAAACVWAFAQQATKTNTALAARAMAMIATPSLALRAELAERQGRWDEAIELHRENGDHLRALRLSREHGSDVERSRDLARSAGDDASAAILDRLACLHRDINSLATADLTENERTSLGKIFKTHLVSRTR